MMDNTIDFSQPRWGHKMHGFTMRQVYPTSIIHRLRDWFCGAYRVSIMVHSNRRPKAGMQIKWVAKSGEITAPIYDVKPCGDPYDMFTIFCRITPNCRSPRIEPPEEQEAT